MKSYKYYQVVVTRYTFVKDITEWTFNGKYSDAYHLKLSTIKDWMDEKTIQSKVENLIRKRLDLPNIMTHNRIRIESEVTFREITSKFYRSATRSSN